MRGSANAWKIETWSDCLSSRTRFGLLRIVMGKGDDPRRQPLGMAVQLADFDLSTDGRMGDVESRQRERFCSTVIDE